MGISNGDCQIKNTNAKLSYAFFFGGGVVMPIEKYQKMPGSSFCYLIVIHFPVNKFNYIGCEMRKSQKKTVKSHKLWRNWIVEY